MEPVSLGLVVFIIAIALVFDFTNGFHDASNSIATVVSTRVLTPGKAVAWAAAFNFLAAFGFGTHVASTIGKGLVDPTGITAWVILSALIGAIVWNMITWKFGLPSSSSHALIGGFGGAALVYGGPQILIWSGFQRTILFIFVAPILGLVLGFFFMILVLNLFKRFTPASVDHIFRRGQLVSAALYSLGHGANDAQKTMGIIVALLISTGRFQKDHAIPWWIILLCHAAIAMGTMSGGWRIVKTMGQKITKLKPVGGFCAESAGAATLFLASFLGIPVSTTHSITGAIMGVGSTTQFSTVKWGVAENILWAWILTIPASGLIAAGCQWLFMHWPL